MLRSLRQCLLCLVGIFCFGGNASATLLDRGPDLV